MLTTEHSVFSARKAAAGVDRFDAIKRWSLRATNCQQEKRRVADIEVSGAAQGKL